MSERVDALRRAVDASPDDPTLRLLLAEALHDDALHDDALQEYERLLAGGTLPGDAALRAGGLAIDAGRADLVRGCIEAARAAGLVEGLAELERRLADVLSARGLERVPVGLVDDDGGPDIPPWLVDPADTVTFDAVGGLDAVKKVIHRMIILPRTRPELYERYGRRGGGGVLLYGPPGCGKTLLARATAGECGVPFLNVRIEQILDPYMGISERNLHASFTHARANTPCVLFLDEVDAIGYARRRQHSSAARTLVDALLQELDAIGSDNNDVLVLAATNAPWDVDDAVLRPGRFDRRIFVPAPDEAARRRILELLLRAVPHEGVDVTSLAKAAPLFSGADVRAVVERAVDDVIDEALASGDDPPVRQHHLERALGAIRPTTLDWLERARNYVEFANAAERWSDVQAYLGSREVRRRLGR